MPPSFILNLATVYVDQVVIWFLQFIQDWTLLEFLDLIF